MDIEGSHIEIFTDRYNNMKEGAFKCCNKGVQGPILTTLRAFLRNYRAQLYCE
jgi:hypothetical protein